MGTNEMMKWTVLSDNRSSDSRLSTEHGLSILLETERHKILLDTGASDLFIRNAKQLGINLNDVDYVFISHGHSDHEGGLRYFLEHNRQAKVIVSPDAMSGEFFSKRGNLHSITTEWPEINEERLLKIEQTCEIAEGIHVIAISLRIIRCPRGIRTFSCRMPMANMCMMISAMKLLCMLKFSYSQVVLIADWRTFWLPVLGL